MPVYNENLRPELELMQNETVQEKLKKLYNSLMGIAEMDDETCDSLEAEFRKNKEEIYF